MKISFLKTGVAMAALAVSSSGAFAATTSDSDSFAQTVTNWTTTLTVDGFNTALGTLTGVKITFSSDVLFEAGLDSESASTFTDASLTGKLKFNVTGPSTAISNALTGSALSEEATGNLAADNDGTSDYSGSDDLFVSETGSYLKNYTVLAADLALFTAATVEFGVGTQGSVLVNAPSNNNSYALHLANAAVSVTYTYTPTSAVPEPESYAMLLAGLAAVGAVARRRRIQG